MRVTGHPSGRFLGYVHVQVASRVYALPVEARPLGLIDGSRLEPGFVAEGPDRLGIVVDSEATEAVVKETIDRASEAAARHIGRKLLNWKIISRRRQVRRSAGRHCCRIPRAVPGTTALRSAPARSPLISSATAM